MAKSRKLSKNRMLLELIENGIDAEKRKQQQFFALAERFRNEQDPEAANRLGDELGHGLWRLMPQLERWDTPPSRFRHQRRTGPLPLL